MFDDAKRILTAKPEHLPEKDLGRAKALGNALTGLRKITYLLFAALSAVAGWAVFHTLITLQNANPIIEFIDVALIVLLAIYILFKARDFIRGTI